MGAGTALCSRQRTLTAGVPPISIPTHGMKLRRPVHWMQPTQAEQCWRPPEDSCTSTNARTGLTAWTEYAPKVPEGAGAGVTNTFFTHPHSCGQARQLSSPSVSGNPPPPPPPGPQKHTHTHTQTPSSGKQAGDCGVGILAAFGSNNTKPARQLTRLSHVRAPQHHGSVHGCTQQTELGPRESGAWLPRQRMHPVFMAVDKTETNPCAQKLPIAGWRLQECVYA